MKETQELSDKNSVPDFRGWAAGAAKELHNVADQIASVSAPEYLGGVGISFARLVEEADDAIAALTADGRIDRDRCIYVMLLDDEADPEALLTKYRDAKGRLDLNLPQDNKSTSGALYVGSSCATNKRKGTLRSRLRQHLIKAPRGTYALSLSEWTSGLSGGIILSAWQYPKLGDGPEGDKSARNIVLAIEEWLAGELQPMLGRRGSRH